MLSEHPRIPVMVTWELNCVQMQTFDLEQLKETDWYRQRPDVIKKAIDQTPPTQLYRFKDSQKQCFIVGYTEPESPDGKVTLIVQKTGVGGPMAEMGLGELDTNQVFDVVPESLEAIPNEQPS